ncbi:hypothetical protein Y919_03335 [Caloranaerobacter azorensis H53214]|uniref:SLH domain-containing protein n=1 Tax=Caloranaerobacter azorensis H53214 TaxID=1156417 RepID=A0A096DNW6_9FIRM|nr:S-layer homology domain-containing protein [Caloranaerobacter azorensis]KGG80951.1 hypothetical protein Y919_03335 [Caloranaerobacter azorensis H53214]
MHNKFSKYLSFLLIFTLILANLINFTTPNLAKAEGEVISIAEARILPNNTYATIEGIVTADLGNNIYIQDDTAGIIVRLKNLDLNPGDKVRVYGKIGQYYGMAQIYPDTIEDITVVQEKVGVPEPQLITSSDLNSENGENFEGELVKIQNVTVTEVDKYKNFKISDKEGTAIVKLNNTSWLEVGKTYSSITGVVTYNYKKYKIYPRTIEDIEVETNKVAPVIAEPPSGEVEAGTEVVLTTATEGATIYYAVYDEVYNFVEYTMPITINEPMTILAKASKDGMEDSEISKFSYTIKEKQNAITIAEARGKDKKAEVTVQGIITYAEKNTLIYIQDDTAGIKVDTYGTGVDLSNFKEGDIVLVTGLIDSYKDELKISVKSEKNIVLISSGNDLPEPKVITLNQVADYQGQLVKIKMARLTDVTSDPYSFYITDSTGTELKLYYSKAKNFNNENYKVGEYYDIIGIAATYYNPQIKLRYGSDMVKQTPPEDPDAKLPLIYNLKPANMVSTFEKTPEISAKLEKTEADIDFDSIKMYLDGTQVTPIVDGMTVTYAPKEELEYGEHEVRLEVSDVIGRTKKVEWYFVVDNKDAKYNFYYGVPHSHTSYSDGKGTPTDAYEHAKQNGLNFLIVTDHSNWLNGVTDNNYEYNPDTNQYEEVEGSEWYKTRKEAEAIDRKYYDFLALRGFEMTSGDWGHMNVINSVYYVEAKKQMTGLAEFYEWLAKQENTVAAFNHPNWPDDSFNDLAYVAELDRIINLIEVGNGAPPYSYTRSEKHYFKALDNGWHVGAINGQDNHSWNWGDPDNLTVVIAESLNKDVFLDAMRNRRTYSTETRTLKLTVKANGHWMGSVLDVEKGDPINFEIIAEDREVPITEVQLITNGGNIIDRKKVGSSNRVEWHPSVIAGGGAEWYVVKVIHENGSWGIASAIYTPASENDVKLSKLEVNPDTTMPGYETTIEATVSNMGIRDAVNIEVKFYEESISEENLIGIDNVELIKAGESAVLSTTWTPSKSGPVKIIAKLTEIEGVTTVTEMTTTIKVVASNGKTVLIDCAHDNVDVTGAMLNLMELLRRYGYTVKLNTEPITVETLKDVDVLVINTPKNTSADFTMVEEAVIGEWIRDGGAAMIASKSNYNYDSTMMNSLMEAIGTNIRFNDDNIYEPEDSDKYSGGMVWSVYAYNLPKTESGLNENMEAIRIFSGCSLVNAENNALINNPDTGLEILLGGNATSYNANPGKDAYVYNVKGEMNGEAIPIIAKEYVGKGKIVAAGRHFYSDYEIVNDVSNTALTLRLIDWLAGYDRVKTIKEVRENAKEGDIVTVKGIVTVPTGNFFDVVYIQDGTSGICLYGSQSRELPIGTEVIATGAVHYFEGELELAFDNFNYEVLYVGPAEKIEPIVLSTKEAMLPQYTGMLVKTKGRITEHSEKDSYFKINDGSGDAYIHVDGYIGADMGRFKVGDWVEVTGIASIGAAGPRIRVRFYDDMAKTDKIVINDDNDDENYDRDKGDADKTKYGKVTITKDKNGNMIGILEVDKNKIEKQLEKENSSKVEIKVPVSKNAAEILVNMDAELVDKISEKGKELVINTKDVIVGIEPGSIKTEEGDKIVFKVKRMKGGEVEEILFPTLLEEYSPTSIVYDINLNLQKKDRVSKIRFNKPINVIIKYNPDRVSNLKKIGVYYYNEETGRWEFIGGRVTADETITFTTEHFSKYIVMEYNKVFEDVDMPWVKDAVEILAARHVIDGVDDKNFAPNDNVTRAQFVKMLVNALDLKYGKKEVKFKDVSDGTWYERPVKIAASLGIVEGYNEMFNPNGEITREEMAVMIVRALKLVAPEEDCIIDAVFKDENDISDWAKEAVKVAASRGLVEGVGGNRFAPKESATRAQAAVIIYRLFNILRKI